MRFAGQLARIVFGLIFIAASIDKIAHPEAFATIIYNYHILPESLINLVAIFLPWVEAVCGLALVFNRLSSGASFILVCLMIVFLAALGYNLSRGLSVACGCFSTSPESGTNMTRDIIRDGAILLLGLVVMVRSFLAARAERRPRLV